MKEEDWVEKRAYNSLHYYVMIEKNGSSLWAIGRHKGLWQNK